MKRFTQLTTAGLLATALLLTACASDWDQRMQAIKADPMATATWDDFELLGTYETTNDSYKSPGPHLTICYKTAIPTADALKVVMSTAAEQGWSELQDAKRTSSTEATKRVRYGTFGNATFILRVAARQGISCHDSHDANLRISISNY